jgi:hypothetical protein
MKAVDELAREIKRREEELAALKQALVTLKGIGTAKAPPARAGKRRPRTPAEKRKLSAVMKKVWQKRKAAAKTSQKAETARGSA